MAKLDIEVRSGWIIRRLTINGVEYEEVEIKGECKDPITKQLRLHYPAISEYDFELVEQALCSDIDDAQDALQDLEDDFETF